MAGFLSRLVEKEAGPARATTRAALDAGLVYFFASSWIGDEREKAEA